MIKPYKIRYTITNHHTNNYQISLYFDLCNSTNREIEELKKSLYQLEVEIGSDASYYQKFIMSAKSYNIRVVCGDKLKCVKEMLFDILSQNSMCFLYMEESLGVKFLSSAILGHIFTEESVVEEF
jgi:hypothetical protein